MHNNDVILLKDKKKRTSQKEFQRDAKGEGFIDNDTLLSAAAKAAFDLAEALAEEDVIVQTATQLAKETDDGIPLSDAQMSVLCDYIRQRVKKHQKLDSIEAALIDDPDKNVYYMWGQIKRRCLKGDTIAWPHAAAVRAAPFAAVRFDVRGRLAAARPAALRAASTAADGREVIRASATAAAIAVILEVLVLAIFICSCPLLHP